MKNWKSKTPAEERVLWDICSQLESILVEPFNENYAELLVKASKELLKEELAPQL